MSSVRTSRFTDTKAAPQIRVSFEFFPPKTAEMEQTLWEAIARLAPLQPNFVSVTYGAGGSTRERTHATVKRILAETSLHPAAHLTCVGATRAEVDAVAPGIAQGEMPPLWVIGAEGDGQLVNDRVQGNYMIVERLFAAAELKLGGKHQETVRVVRTDGRPQS